MFDTYTPEAGDRLTAAQAFSLDKDPARKKAQFQPGDAVDAQALGLSVFRVRGLLNTGRLTLVRAGQTNAETKAKTKAKIKTKPNPKAPPAQSAATPDSAAD